MEGVRDVTGCRSAQERLGELTPRERAELAQYLIRSLEDDDLSEAEWGSAWTAELERREEEIRSGKVIGVPADEVFRRIRERHA